MKRSSYMETSTAEMRLCEGELDLQIFECFRAALDPSVLGDIYRDFLAQTRDRMTVLLGGASSDLIHSLSHTIFGTAGMLGAHRVADAAWSLDGATAEGAAIEQHVKAISEACEALETALRAQKVNL